MSANGTLRKHESLSDEQQSILKQKSGKIERLETEITNLSKPLLGDDAKDKGWVKHVTPGVLAVFQDDSSWDKLTLKAGDPLLKQQQQHSQELQKATGSSWKKVKDVLNADVFDGNGDDGMADGEPATTTLNYRDMKTYGNLPMEDEIPVVKCDSCQRPILASSFKEHLDTCLKKGSNSNSNSNKGNRKNTTNGNSDYNKKKVSAQGFFSENDDDDDDDDDDHLGTTKQNSKDVTLMKKKKKMTKPNNSNLTDDDTNSNKNSNTNSTTNNNNSTSTTISTTSSANSKRTPPNVAEKGEKKKVKKEKSKAKGAKQKAPLDLDKQCGVIQQPNGLPCTRSLTCKSHSMGAKRAVAGRSQPYDVLLAAYQKKAIGRPQAGAMGGMIGKNTKLKKQHSFSPGPSGGSNLNNNGGNSGMNINTGGNAAAGSSSLVAGAAGSGTTANDDYFDSEEEVENVMQALRSNHPAPLAQKPYFYVKRQRKCFRLRDILLEAITPKTNSIESMQHNPTSTQTNGNISFMTAPSPSSFSGSSVTASLLSSQNDFNFYQQQQQKSYPFQQNIMGNGMVPRNIGLHQQQQQQQQRSSSSASPSPSPLSGTIGYPGIYNSASVDGLSDTSSVVSTYSIR